MCENPEVLVLLAKFLGTSLAIGAVCVAIYLPIAKLYGESREDMAMGSIIILCLWPVAFISVIVYTIIKGKEGGEDAI